jgi:hypothetical protein
MKLRCIKPNGYRGSINVAAGEVVEVGDELAAKLLALPGRFEPVGRQAGAGEVVPETPKMSAKDLPAPPRKKPYRAKAK